MTGVGCRALNAPDDRPRRLRRALHGGPEVAVVSTKTFVSALVAFVLFALHLGRMKDVSMAQGPAQ
jgi:glucosamine 6-phosphate synthetase-like amidotransferase/phosphosugar isomerase protein